MNKSLKIVFIVFAVFAVVFGVIRIGQNINLTNQPDTSQPGAHVRDSQDFDEAKLRVLDTDEDGITDWEELNIHSTSPYLSDSDSDGIDDNVEIAQGTDPNCPIGRVCGSDIIETLEQIQQDAALQEQESSQDQIPLIKEFSQESQEALDALEKGSIPTPDQIRSLLRDSGIPKEQLDISSDEELVQLFQEVASQTQ